MNSIVFVLGLLLLTFSLLLACGMDFIFGEIGFFNFLTIFCLWIGGFALLISSIGENKK